MPLSPGNIEIVARAICERQTWRSGASSDLRRLSAEVDRDWYCGAAALEAGLLDDNGEPLCSTDDEAGLAADRDWRQRHPDDVGPARPRVRRIGTSGRHMVAVANAIAMVLAVLASKSCSLHRDEELPGPERRRRCCRAAGFSRQSRPGH